MLSWAAEGCGGHAVLRGTRVLHVGQQANTAYYWQMTTRYLAVMRGSTRIGTVGAAAPGDRACFQVIQMATNKSPSGMVRDVQGGMVPPGVRAEAYGRCI